MLKEGLLITHRFEAANATTKTVKTESALAKHSVVRPFAPVQGISALTLMNKQVDLPSGFWACSQRFS